jgi:hypothetical protein
MLELVKDPAKELKLKQEGNKLFLTFRETETIVEGLKKLEALANAM